MFSISHGDDVWKKEFLFLLQLEAILKDKVKHNYVEVKKKFKDNDPEQKGNVSR